jgi:hypothetical protein
MQFVWAMARVVASLTEEFRKQFQLIELINFRGVVKIKEGIYNSTRKLPQNLEHRLRSEGLRVLLAD